MKRSNTLICFVAACALGFSPAVIRTMALSPSANAAIGDDHDWDSDMPVKEQLAVRKTFPMTAAAAQKALEVDNVFGSIEVVGTSGNEVQLVVTQTFRAETKEKLEL